MKHVITVHSQVMQDLPELSFKLCHALEPGGWAYIKVRQRKNSGREHTSYTALPSLPSKAKEFPTRYVNLPVGRYHHPTTQHRKVPPPENTMLTLNLKPSAPGLDL